MGAGGRRRTGRFIGNYIRSNELGDGPQASHRYSFLDDQTVPINQKDVKGHYGCVNAIEASSDEQYLTSGGDDHRVLLWSICDVQTRREPKPIAVMRQLHSSNIFSLAFSNEGDRIYSAGNDALLLVHDIATGNMIDWFKTDQAIYNVSTNPIDDSVIISASQDGRVRLHDLRTSEETITARSQGTMYCAQFNPRRPNLISVCSETDGLTIHDRRKFERPCVRLGLSQKSLLGICSSVMYGQWSSNGEGIFATRNQNCPIYYDLNDGSFVEFKDPNYRNSCTVKSCSFITDDLVMTGSDDWNIYVWKLPQNVSGEQTIDKAYRVLEGHRSIVNHARYSALNRMIFSSGVEKIIKLWSEWELNGSYRNPNRRFLLLGHQPRQSRSEESVEEDLTMLAFFDRLTTAGEDDNMTDLEDDMEVSVNEDEEENSDEGRSSIARLRRLRLRLQVANEFVVTSPEMSDVELLSEGGVHSYSDDDDEEDEASLPGEELSDTAVEDDEREGTHSQDSPSPSADATADSSVLETESAGNQEATQELLIDSTGNKPETENPPRIKRLEEDSQNISSESSQQADLRTGETSNTTIGKQDSELHDGVEAAVTIIGEKEFNDREEQVIKTGQEIKTNGEIKTNDKKDDDVASSSQTESSLN